MNFVLIDDIQSHHDILKSKLELVCKSQGIPCTIAVATTEWKDVVDYAQHAPKDTVYFLDIELTDEINGIDLCKQIKERNPLSYIVYVSAYQQYALLCCQSHAFDFLLKPWTDEQLHDCLRAIQKDIAQRNFVPCLEVKLGTRLLRLPHDQILYFSKDKMSVSAHCAGGHMLSWRETAEELVGRLPADCFLQCHKSFIVNLQHVREFHWSEDQLVMDNGDTLPISRRRIEELKKQVNAAANVTM